MTYSPWDMLLLSDTNQYSNFQSFLDSVTPIIPSKPRSKVRMPILNGAPKPMDQEIVESFSLRSFFDFYKERSYYGVGVPILLNNGQGIVQYYCPSLSALQIYTQNPPISLRSPRQRQASSDESENDEFSMTQSNNSSSKSSDTSEDSSADQLSMTQSNSSFGDLYFQFNETLGPYQRVPFCEKIDELAKKYPGLMKLQSTDLSPYSWIAVAWYPIYQIPLTKDVKALSACFVTYHSLSAFKGDPILAPKGHPQKYTFKPRKEEKEGEEEKASEKRSEARIAPFAAVTYKMNGELWTKPETADEEKISSCLNAAASWVKLLDFYHHDFCFCMARRSFR